MREAMLERLRALRMRLDRHRRGGPGFWKSSDGSAAFELVFLLWFLLVPLVAGGVDFGKLMYQEDALVGATRAGAEYAQANCAWSGTSLSGSSCTTTNIENQVTGFMSFSPSVTAGASTFCTCVPTSGTSYPAAGSCPCSGTSAVYINVTAQQSFSPMISWASALFPSTLNAGTAVRIQ
jgi:hypothetical protein